MVGSIQISIALVRELGPHYQITAVAAATLRLWDSFQLTKRIWGHWYQDTIAQHGNRAFQLFGKSLFFLWRARVSLASSTNLTHKAYFKGCDWFLDHSRSQISSTFKTHLIYSLALDFCVLPPQRKGFED